MSDISATEPPAPSPKAPGESLWLKHIHLDKPPEIICVPSTKPSAIARFDSIPDTPRIIASQNELTPPVWLASTSIRIAQPGVAEDFIHPVAPRPPKRKNYKSELDMKAINVVRKKTWIDPESYVTVPISEAEKHSGFSGWKWTQEKRKNVYMSFDQSRTWARRLRLTNRFEWKEFSTFVHRTKYLRGVPIKPRTIPNRPDRVYPDFRGWDDFLGAKTVGKLEMLEMEEARSFLKRMKFKTSHQYKEFITGREVPFLPRCPNTYYYNWRGWHYFLGLSEYTRYEKWAMYRSYDEAVKFVHKLELPSMVAYTDWWETNKPLDLPRSPQTYYKADWTTVGAFLGKALADKLDIKALDVSVLVIVSGRGIPSGCYRVFVEKEGYIKAIHDAIRAGQQVEHCYMWQNTFFEVVNNLMRSLGCVVDMNAVTIGINDLYHIPSVDLLHNHFSAFMPTASYKEPSKIIISEYDGEDTLSCPNGIQKYSITPQDRQRVTEQFFIPNRELDYDLPLENRQAFGGYDMEYRDDLFDLTEFDD